MFNKILAAIDTSAMSEQVFKTALDLAQIHSDSSQLWLVNIMSPFDAGYPDLPVLPALDPHYPPHLAPEIVQSYVKKWESYQQPGLSLLNEFQQRATQAGINPQTLQTFGEPGATICNLAQDWGADTIVIGRHGRTGLNEVFLGSVSNYVMHHAPCSVLVVQGT